MYHVVHHNPLEARLKWVFYLSVSPVYYLVLCMRKRAIGNIEID
jgi:hypothetical protein